MSTSKVLLGIVIGASVGATLGVLFAPDKGENTRKKISQKGQDYVDNMKARYNSILDGFMRQADAIKEDLDDHVARVKSKAQSLKKEA